MMEFSRSPAQLHQLHAAARTSGHRRLAVLAGAPDWTRSIAEVYLGSADTDARLWIGEESTAPAPSMGFRRALTRLGTDLELLVYDAWSGFDPDAFGAATGSVRGGGLILLLTPLLADWPGTPDPAAARLAVAGHAYARLRNRFIRRLVEILRRDPDAWIWTQGHAPPPAPGATTPTVPHAPGDSACLTRDQAEAVAAVTTTARSSDTAALVLTANRGRGKSAALGIAAGRLLQAGRGTVVVTAPRSMAAENVFRHARDTCPSAHAGKRELRHGEAVMEYTAPDALIQSPPEAQLLLVDEAAGIPAPLLTALLRHFPRVVFATTIHGYEGTGRGFAIRFTEALDRYRPGWRNLALEAPVRWARDDPVERFVSKALMLDAEPAAAAAIAQTPAAGLEHRRLDRDRLAADESTLRQLFGLLVNAHYRTTPSDLRNLLDGPTTAVHALLHGDTVLAAALTVDEGPFDPALAAAIWLGRKRPHGHLLPQSLTFHGGLVQFAQLRCRRIMRIAVHPATRRRGHGRRLVDTIAGEAVSAGMDVLGTSFGATTELMAFWRATGLEVIRLGHRREASSGVHAAMMGAGLDPAGRHGVALATSRLRGDLPTLLAGPLRDLEPEIRQALPTPSSPQPPSEADYLLARGFAGARRPLAPTLPALQRILHAGPPPTFADAHLLERGVLRLLPLKQANAGPIKATEERLRTAVGRYLDGLTDPRCDAANQVYGTIVAQADAAGAGQSYTWDGRGRVAAVSGARETNGRGW